MYVLPVWYYQFQQQIVSLTMNVQRQLEQEITQRVHSESPTKYDLDFYKRKVNRLENDCNAVQEDLNRARIRLRRAQDFELKYQLILKQNTQLKNDVDAREKELTQKKSELENVRLQVDDKKDKGDTWQKEKLQLQREVEKWKVKTEEAEEKRIGFMLEHRQKSDLNQKRQLEGIKREFAEKEEGYQFQLRQLKKTLGEKENIEGIISSRVDKVRTEKDEEIKRLQEFIEKQRVSNDEAYKEKSEELDKLKNKFQKIFNFELQNLKKSVEDQDELFSIELNGFREMIGIKNDEIDRLLSRLRKQSEDHTSERSDLQAEVSMLKQKLYIVERKNEIQIDHIKERITRIHAADIENIQQRYNSINGELKEQCQELEKQIKEKDKMVQADKREYERMKEEMRDRLKERDTRIEHLQERIKESGDMNDNEMKNLHQSLNQIESQKEIMTTEYQTNVGFLNQQMSKMTVKNEILNATVKSLHQEIVKTKHEYTEMIQDIENRWKEERRELEAEREREREKIEKMMDAERQRQREYRVKEKQLERAREKEEREKNKLQFIIDEMERDTERLNNYIKQLDDAIKRELKKNQSQTLESGGVRRQLNSELERQKSELEAIKRMQVDQMKRKMQIELVKLMSENEQLTNNLHNKTIALDNLEDEFKKLEHLNRNIDKINKEKLVEYEKKMSTLNSEIFLTKTLYEKFMENKSRQQAK